MPLYVKGISRGKAISNKRLKADKTFLFLSRGAIIKDIMSGNNKGC